MGRRITTATTDSVNTLYTVKLAYELQTLLTIMARRVQQIRTRTPLRVVGLLDQDFAELDGAVDGAFEIARELLAAGRPSDAEPPLTDLNEVLGQSMRSLERLAGPRVTVSVSLQAKESIVQAEIVDLEWLLFNLVANARDAMPAGGTISIRTDNVASAPTETPIPPRRQVRISVSDTGHAIPLTTLKRVFEPFSTTRSGRVGLGLTTVAVTERRLRGRLVVESETDVGTTVQTFLPIVGSSAARRLITDGVESADQNREQRCD